MTVSKYLFLLFLVPSVFAQSRADSLSIKQTILDYAQGWYTGNAELMARSLHPKLAKRVLLADANGALMLNEMTASELVENTRLGKGKTLPPKQQVADVTILDVFGNIATAKLQMRRRTDYLHLLKEDGTWRIINVLWEVKNREE